MKARQTIRSATVFPDRGFPLRVMRLPKHRDTRFHGHEFNELVIVLGGTARHVTSAGVEPLEAGDVFLLRGQSEHGYRDARGLQIVNVLFAPRRLRLPLADIGSLPGYHALFRFEAQAARRGPAPARARLAPADLGEASRLAGVLERELAERRPGHRFMACSHLMQLIGFLSRRCLGGRAAGGGADLGLARALGYMDQHYPERLTVAAIARAARLSESTLLRRFREGVGRPPIDYLIRLRIARACELLQGEDLRVTDVAFRCGFSDGNYFSRQFRRVMGRSPRSYRRGLPVPPPAPRPRGPDGG